MVFVFQNRISDIPLNKPGCFFFNSLYVNSHIISVLEEFRVKQVCVTVFARNLATSGKNSSDFRSSISCILHEVQDGHKFHERCVSNCLCNTEEVLSSAI